MVSELLRTRIRQNLLVSKYMQIYLNLAFFLMKPNAFGERTQVITWLGAVLNTSTYKFSATAKRVTSLQEDLATPLVTPSSCHPVRKLTSVCGKIISLGPCVGNVSRLMSRNLFAVINTAPTWNSYVRLSSEALAELVFWKSNVASLNGIPIWPVRHKPSKIVYSDASGSACGSFIEFEGKTFHQNWSDFEKAQSSTFRELLAVSLSVKAFAESLRAQTVSWFTVRTLSGSLMQGLRLQHYKSLQWISIVVVCLMLLTSICNGSQET